MQNQAPSPLGKPSLALHVSTEIVPLLAPVYEVYFEVPVPARIDVPSASPYNEEIQSFGEPHRVPFDDLKKTINLPKTAFPMKANLPQNEPKMLARWEEMDIYQRIREARAGEPMYVMHDGPPY